MYIYIYIYIHIHIVLIFDYTCIDKVKLISTPKSIQETDTPHNSGSAHHHYVLVMRVKHMVLR